MLLCGSKCILGNGDWLLEAISTIITEHVCEPETSSKPKKKKKRRLEVENEIGLWNLVMCDVILVRC